MKTKTFLTLTLVFLLLNSCSKNEETLYNSFSSYSIEFSIADTAGNDLLDPKMRIHIIPHILGFTIL